MGAGARASDPSGSSNQAVRRETARTGRAIRQAGQGVWRPTGLPQADRRAEGPPPILERRNDDRQPQRHVARDSSLEADLERGSARVGADRRVHIRHRGACAPKRHFHVRASASLCCWLSYSCGTAAGTVLPLRGTRPLTGATPPFRDALIGIGEGWHVHAHATLRRGVAPDHRSLREGRRASDADGV